LSLDAASNSSGHSVNSKQQQVLGFSQLLQQVLAVSGAQLQQASGDLRRLLWQLQDAAGGSSSQRQTSMHNQLLCSSAFAQAVAALCATSLQAGQHYQ
jgi:hypothetical protein